MQMSDTSTQVRVLPAQAVAQLDRALNFARHWFRRLLYGCGVDKRYFDLVGVGSPTSIPKQALITCSQPQYWLWCR